MRCFFEYYSSSHTQKMSAVRKQRLIDAELEGGGVSASAIMMGLGALIVCGLIATVITLGVLYGQAAQWPKNTTSTVNLVFPAVTRRNVRHGGRIVIAEAITQGANLATANVNVTNMLVETSTTYEVTRIININGTVTSDAKKRGVVPSVDVNFNIVSFFPSAQPATAHVGSTFSLTLTPTDPIPARPLVCTIQAGGVDINCKVLILTGELVAPGGTFTTAGTFSYIVNK
jgi:hypothetical protein